VTARAICEETQLLLLDPIFHFAPLAVEQVVEVLRVTLDIGDHESVVRTLREPFRLHDHVAPFVPCYCPVPDRSENTISLPGFPYHALRIPHGRVGATLKHIVARKTQDVDDIVPLAPSHEPPPAKPESPRRMSRVT